MTIDPRLTERRKSVAEINAKRNVSRLLKFLIAVVVIGGGVWLVFSPWLSVARVETTGIHVSDANEILVAHGVMAGTPMIQIDKTATETALLADPWISSAVVARHWPRRVSVEISERTPVAWTETSSGWTRRAIDGVALPSDPGPPGDVARIELPMLTPGEAETSGDMTGALEFVAALSTDVRKGTVVTRSEGELWATVQGFQVRLGRAVDMRDKALSLEALLKQDLQSGSVVVLIAPTKPSVRVPGTPDKTSEDGENAGADGSVAKSSESTSGSSGTTND